MGVERSIIFTCHIFHIRPVRAPKSGSDSKRTQSDCTNFENDGDAMML